MEVEAFTAEAQTLLYLTPDVVMSGARQFQQCGLTAEYPAIFKLYPQQGWILGHEAYNQGGYADTRIRS